MDKRVSLLLASVTAAVIKTNGINSADLALAVRICFGSAWTADLHVMMVELLIEAGMLEMDRQTFYITATPSAKAAHAEDEVRRKAAVKPNMPQAEA